MSLFIFIAWQVKTESSLLLKSEKVYTILAVLLVIFGVLLFVMIRTQLKLGKMEEQIDQFSQQTHKKP